MSVINKKPFIQSVLDTLTAQQIATLKGLLDGAETTIFRSYINENYPFSTDDKGVSHCVVEVKDEVFTGYLLYNNTYCVLVAYNGERTQAMKIVKLDYANKQYEIIPEDLDINELRRLTDETQESGGDAWVESMKTVMENDTTQNEVVCGIHFYCDGDLETGQDVVVGRDLIVDGLNNIQDPDGNALIPAPLNEDLGKFLKLGTTGIMWSNLPTYPDIQVVAKATFEGEGYVYLINTIYVVYDTDGTCYVRYYTE